MLNIPALRAELHRIRHSDSNLADFARRWCLKMMDALEPPGEAIDDLDVAEDAATLDLEKH